MPRVLFYENGFAPTTRTIREIAILRRAGWDVIFAHKPSVAEEVAKLDVTPFVVEQPTGNLFHHRLAAELVELNARLAEASARVKVLAEQYKQVRGPTVARLEKQRLRVTGQIEKLAKRVRRLHAKRRLEREAQARAKLETAKAERVGIAELIRSTGRDIQEELQATKAARTALAAEIRAIHAARRTPTPLTAGTWFGDLGRIEAAWHDAAQELATVKADLFWCADLDGLAPMVWAREAADGSPPLIFDCHEMWSALEYMPEMYQVAWRMVMDRFVPKADAVLAVSQPIVDALVEEHGARRTLLVPNFATPGIAPPQGVRETIGLADEVSLVVHVGHLSYGRHPRFELVVAMLVEQPDVHMAYVGTRDAGILEEITELATVNGVADRLHFVDAVPLEHLRGFLASADVSLFMYDPARCLDNRYAMPFKLYDSLSAGVPVVAPDGGIAADFLVRENLGRRFELGVPGSLGLAVRDLLTDPAPRTLAKQRAREFTWAEIEPALLALVDEVMRKHAPSVTMSS